MTFPGLPNSPIKWKVSKALLAWNVLPSTPFWPGASQFLRNSKFLGESQGKTWRRFSKIVLNMNPQWLLCGLKVSSLGLSSAAWPGSSASQGERERKHGLPPFQWGAPFVLGHCEEGKVPFQVLLLEVPRVSNLGGLSLWLSGVLIFRPNGKMCGLLAMASSLASRLEATLSSHHPAHG